MYFNFVIFIFNTIQTSNLDRLPNLDLFSTDLWPDILEMKKSVFYALKNCSKAILK